MSGPPAAICCPRCGADFTCDPLGPCWCKDEGFRLPIPAAGEICLCPACLRAEAKAQAAAR